MVSKSSAVWTMSSKDLIEHLNSLGAPDQVYWDSRELKKQRAKFQSLDWSYWPRPKKVDGKWTFADSGADPVPDEAGPVAARVEQATACKIISLKESEKDIYTGAGLRLARFDSGELVKLFAPDPPYDSEGNPDIPAMIHAIAGWMHENSSGGSTEIWLVSCSCYELCDPRRVTLDDIEYINREFKNEAIECARELGQAVGDGDDLKSFFSNPFVSGQPAPGSAAPASAPAPTSQPHRGPSPE